MKRLIFCLLILSLSIFLQCSKDKQQAPPSLNIDKASFNLSSVASRDSFFITSNVAWSISSNSSWCIVTPSSGTINAKVYLTISPNPNTAARVADLTISATGINSTTIHVQQNGSTPLIVVDRLSLNEKSQGQRDSILITSNVPWSISVPQVASSWLVSDKTSDTAGNTTVHFDIASNNTTNPRTAIVTVSPTNSSATPISISITQDRQDVIITSFTPKARGGETMTINGYGFSLLPSEDVVKINGVTTTVNAVTAGSLTVTVPPKVGSGPVEVKVNSKSDTAYTFTYEWIGHVVLLAGSSGGYADGNGTNAQFLHPAGLAVDAANNVYVADYANYRVRKISPSGDVTTLPGRVPYDPSNPSSPLIFGLPSDVALDGAGNLFVTETNSDAVSRISASGEVTLLAGGNAPGYMDGTGTGASLYWPAGIVTETSGNSFVADLNNHRIRKVTPGGVVTTIAGGVQGYADGTGVSASFNKPYSLAEDGAGNFFVTDLYNLRIRKVTSIGVVTTIAGGGNGSDDGIGTAAGFAGPLDIAIDPGGNLFVGDQNKIRWITSSGKVTTVNVCEDPAGNTVEFNGLYGVAFGTDGILYVSDYYNNKIWKVTSIQ